MRIHITLSSDDNRADVVRKRYIILYKWVWLPLDKRLLVSIIYISSIDDIYFHENMFRNNKAMIDTYVIYSFMTSSFESLLKVPKTSNWVVQVYIVSRFRKHIMAIKNYFLKVLKSTEYYCLKGLYAGGV